MNQPPSYPQPRYPQQQPQQQQQPHAPPPPRKKASGCLVALAIVGGLLVLGGLAVGFVAWRFASSEEGKKLVSAVSSGAQAINEATHAPGTAELRAAGCDTAAVMDVERVQAIAAPFVDAGKLDPSDPHLFVTCQAKRGGAAPTCDHVAQTYVAAVGGHAAGRFGVNVTQSGGTECEGAYAEDGTPEKKKR